MMDERREQEMEEWDLERLYREVSGRELPESAIQHVDAGKAQPYPMTGYNYAVLVNVLNEVVGVGRWFAATKYQDLGGEIVCELTLCVGRWRPLAEAEASMLIEEQRRFVVGGCIFEPVAAQSSFGGCQVRGNQKSNAYKGAMVNAFKKCAHWLLSLGSKAYEGTLDEDYAAAREANLEAEASQKTASVASTSRRSAPQRADRWATEGGQAAVSRSAPSEPSPTALELARRRTNAAIYSHDSVRAKFPGELAKTLSKVQEKIYEAGAEMLRNSGKACDPTNKWGQELLAQFFSVEENAIAALDLVGVWDSSEETFA